MTTISNNIEISFWHLISNTAKIEIPIIQRDYAQGRDNEKAKKIRLLFLKSLINAMESENEVLELDFVYGNVEKDVFQPLDGQQRLTTLFLLHWYIALKTGVLSNTQNQFLKFTYETRISSREFCIELVENGKYLGEGKTISKKIYDSKWFFLSWKKDPTIKAMLTMLDCIEERLKDKDDERLKSFWEKLISENPPITFHFKKLNDIGLTDDLYIKMNARGKALTDFENFKARFEKHIKEGNQERIDWEDELQESPLETFSHKIDTLWTDLFWKHRGDTNFIDNKFIKFIAGIAINCYAQNLEIFKSEEDEQNTRKALLEKSKGKITEEAVKRERIESRIKTLSNNPADVSPDDFPTKYSFEYLKKCFDIYSVNRNDEKQPNNLSLWGFCEEKIIKINNSTKLVNNLFIEFVKDSRTEFQQRALFFAQTQYFLSSEEFHPEYFSHWMRVVRNIVQNATIDSADTLISAINLINELSSGCNNIYEFLSNAYIKSGFTSTQLGEESLKAKLIQSENQWKLQIFKIEDDNFLKGEISILLDFCMIEGEHNFQKFECLSNAFLLLFEAKDDLLRMALLTQDNYAIWDGYTYSLEAHRHSLLNTENEWKVAFRKRYEKFISAVHKLLSSVENLKDERSDLLKNIINSSESFNDWRDLIIKNSKSLTNCYHKRICLTEKSLFILEKTRVVGKNYKKIQILTNP